MDRVTRDSNCQQPPRPPSATELAILRKLERLERLFDEFAGVYLNAKFPYGKSTDRWSRR